MRHKSYYNSTGFLDLLFNMLLGFVFLFSIAFMMVNPEIKKSNTQSKAEYIITMEWHDDSWDDVDLWLQDPLDNLIFFRQKDVGLTHLDRDDRGEINDVIQMGNIVKKISVNREVMSIRGFIPGEWILNVHMYKRRDPGATTSVRIRMDKLNPKVKTVFHKEVILGETKDEITVTRFTMTAGGKILDFNNLPKKLVILAPLPDVGREFPTLHRGQVE